jgi:hypothetical protein
MKPSPATQIARHLAVACAALLCAAGAHAGDAPDPDNPPVTPYRPSVAAPAALSTPGWVEFEGGGLRASGPADGGVRTTLPYTFKLAFTPDWGVRVGGDAWVRQVDGDGTPAQRGGGDTTIVLKRRFAVSDATAWGLELGRKFPTAGPTLGSGKADTVVNGIFSSDFAPGWHADLNFNETRLGNPAAWQTGWAAAFTRAIGDAFGATGELSGAHVAGATGTSQALVAASWSAAPALVLDGGYARGLNDASVRNQWFAGLTVRLGRLF